MAGHTGRDRSKQQVLKEVGGRGQVARSLTERRLGHAVRTSGYEERAAFEVDSSEYEPQQHRGKDEPRSGRA
jgi:hypothetical protein